MRVVLDTNIIVSAMRSPAGASAELLRAARQNEVVLLANVALCIEYEAICMLAEHRSAAGLDPAQVGVYVDAIISMVEPVETHFLWRPYLQDAADELVLEAAVNGRADAIVTFNQRHFAKVPSHFDIDLLLPRDALKRIRP